MGAVPTIMTKLRNGPPPPTHNEHIGKGISDENVVHQDEDESTSASFSSGENIVKISNGKHTYKFANGDLYYGDWENGQMHGHGTLTVAASGAVYNGNFSHNEFNGNGVFIYSNGNVYKGSFLNGCRHGPGCMDFADGSSMKGIWKHGRKLEGGE